jgi:hypothetical protein
VAATSLIAFGLVRRYAESQALDQLRRSADAIAGQPAPEGSELAQARQLRPLLGLSGTSIAFVSPQGQVTGDPVIRDVAASIDLSSVTAGSRLEGTVRTAGGELAYVALPVSRPRRGPVAVVLVRPVGPAREL